MTIDPTPQCLPINRPKYLQETSDGWLGADYTTGPWWPIPAPQAKPPFPLAGSGGAEAVMTSTNRPPLSPAAQAVIDAAYGLPVKNRQPSIAAALRAAADLERSNPWPTQIEGAGARWMRDQLHTIAAELEGHCG